MRDYQILRGPDACGELYSTNHALGFSHRRLSIIDLHTSANQPMVFADIDLVIVFNGEIYNYRELRQELIAEGCKFQTQSDTEVFLQAYANWGESALNRLRGMYTFAIWGEKKQSIFLARDPYGIKPLYYANDGKTFRFASHVKALLAGGAESKEPSPAGVAGFMMMGSVPEPHTVYRDIFAVPAGCYLTVYAQGVGVPQRFFSISDIWRQAAERAKICSADELLILYQWGSS